MHGIWLRTMLLGTLFLLPGCAAFFQQEGGPRAVDEVQSRGIRRVAVVEFADLTQQRISWNVSTIFGEALEGHLRMRVLRGPLPRPGPRLAGSWLRAEANAKGVDGFVTGTVTGYQVQPQEGRVGVTMTVRLLAADSGSILWSKHMLAFVPLSSGIAPEEAFRQAITTIAKEFAHDFMPPSS